MKPCLADVNLVLAICHEAHVHHRQARAFAAELGEGDLKICRIVQLGLLRLLCNRHAMADNHKTAAEAWEILGSLMKGVRVSFLSEPPDLMSTLGRLAQHPGSGPNFWTDAYLAALAKCSDLPVATFDHGFRKFGMPMHLVG